MKIIALLLIGILAYYYKKITGLVSSEQFKPTVRIGPLTLAGIWELERDQSSSSLAWSANLRLRALWSFWWPEPNTGHSLRVRPRERL
jgi:hypothetical protein